MYLLSLNYVFINNLIFKNNSYYFNKNDFKKSKKNNE